MADDPKGAADTAPRFFMSPLSVPVQLIIGWLGRKGIRCRFLKIFINNLSMYSLYIY